MDEDGYRQLTLGGAAHRTLFIVIALFAVYSHFKAMTTDPGAVPPDANPIPENTTQDLEQIIKGEQGMLPPDADDNVASSSLDHTTSDALGIHSPSNHNHSTIPQAGAKAHAHGAMPPQTRGKRMCRRCQAFKPPRAHHCRSVSLVTGGLDTCGDADTDAHLFSISISLVSANDASSKWIITGEFSCHSFITLFGLLTLTLTPINT